MSANIVASRQESDFDRFVEYAQTKRGAQVICAVACEAAPLEEGFGISLRPITCIDLPLQRIERFRDLVNAGGLAGQDWDAMCITVLEADGGSSPKAIDINLRQDVMLSLIQQGRADRMVIFASNEEYLKLNNDY